MKPISTSTYTFSDLVGGGYVYVDKTANIHAIAAQAKGQYFIARPRRFGKSLLISTLGEPPPEAIPPEDVFFGLCRAAAEKSPTGRIAILVDEYDKPLLGLLGRPEVSAVRDVLKAFYSVIKTTEPLQRFVLVTGVSKFSKVSIFSDLNNLTDLTMDARSAKLLGYTHEEVLANFPEHLDALAEVEGTDRDGAFAKLVQWYDGYRFHKSGPAMFNPVSVGKCLDSREFKNYWFETGTPTFLVEMLRKTPLDLDRPEAPEEAFSVYEPEAPAILPLMVQTGYLTIKETIRTLQRTTYRLGSPTRKFPGRSATISPNLPSGRAETCWTASTCRWCAPCRPAMRRRCLRRSRPSSRLFHTR